MKDNNINSTTLRIPFNEEEEEQNFTSNGGFIDHNIHNQIRRFEKEDKVLKILDAAVKFSTNGDCIYLNIVYCYENI